MPRIQSNSPPLPEPQRIVRFRPRAWLSFAVVVALGFGAHFVWQRTSAIVSQAPQYRLTLENIRITPPPLWIRSDIRTQALRDANLVDQISLLDDWETLSRRIKEAFEFHPWVASVERITRRLPNTLEIELVYRKPVAAVESSDDSGMMFLPIDQHAVRLPEADLTEAECRYLPRISGITGRPLVGDHWQDERVIGGAKLAAHLADVWQKLRLVEIIANVQSTRDELKPVYRYEIVTTGGTRIVWGTSPGEEIPRGESPFIQKRQRLLDYAAQHGKLESIDGPAILDIRKDLVITPRTARRKTTTPRSDGTQTK